MRRFVLISSLIAATGSRAHTIETEVHDVEWWLLLLLFFALGLYARGIHALWKSAGANHGVSVVRVGAFFAGWLVLAFALLPPLDPLGADLFSAHMLQHELLMLIAAPLLVLGRPLGIWIWGFPAHWRPRIGATTRHAWVTRPWDILTDPLSAWILHAAAIWLWHLPVLFAAALKHEGVHVIQHCSFLFSAILFWWALLRRPSIASPSTIVYLLTTMIHTSALGAFLVFSKMNWYTTYGERAALWGLSALEDQQLGGLIMWMPGGLIYVIAAIALMSRWLTTAEMGKA